MSGTGEKDLSKITEIKKKGDDSHSTSQTFDGSQAKTTGIDGRPKVADNQTGLRAVMNINEKLWGHTEPKPLEKPDPNKWYATRFEKDKDPRQLAEQTAMSSMIAQRFESAAGEPSQENEIRSIPKEILERMGKFVYHSLSAAKTEATVKRWEDAYTAISNIMVKQETGELKKLEEMLKANRTQKYKNKSRALDKLYQEILDAQTTED